MHTKPGMFRTVGEAAGVLATWVIGTAFCLAVWAMAIKFAVVLVAALTQGRSSW